MLEHGECYRQCLKSTPYSTIVVIATILVSIIGFMSSSAYGMSLLGYSESLHNSTRLMASLVGGVICSSVLPLTLATVLAYVITGYIRNELYCAFVKTYIGFICNGMTIVITFVSFLMGCPMLANGSQCGIVTLGSFSYLSLCPDNTSTMEELCYDGMKIGLSFTISLGFCLLVVVGLVFTMMIQAANFGQLRREHATPN
ncbi:hypothetical protein EMCRGX_G028303 [Ephydatia muelleri]